MLSTVSDELIVAVLSFVPPLDLLRSVACVSTRYSSLIASDAFWRCHELSPTSKISDEAGLVGATDRRRFSTNQHQLQQCCIFAAFRKRQDEAEASALSQSLSSSQEEEEDDDRGRSSAISMLDPPPFLEYGSLLVSRSVAIRLRNQRLRRVCAASSTDHVGEGIENVLFDDDEAFRPPPPPPNATIQDWIALWRVLMMRPERWWSSKPSKNQDSNELLLFCLRCPLAVVSQVSIKPLKDPEGRNIVYLWDKMVVRAYRLPPQLLEDPNEERFPGYPGSLLCRTPTTGTAGEGNDRTPRQHQGSDDNMGEPAQSDQDLINMLLDGHDPVYESPEITMDESDQETMTELCLHSSVVANVLTIELLGKRNEQRAERGFYSCVDKVNCRGIPLYANQEERQNIHGALAAVDADSQE